MRERPIMFRPEMVRAILEGRKTQTRRPVRFHPETGYIVEPGGRRRWHRDDPAAVSGCPYGIPGDRLWVRETWQRGECFEVTESPNNHHPSSGVIYYKATEDDRRKFVGRPWRSSMMMPRAASRLALEIVSVRIERLHEITETDAMAEGARHFSDIPIGPLGPFGRDRWSMFSPTTTDECLGTARFAFGEAWDRLYEKTPHAWAANPWVWCVEFRRVDGGAS